MRAELFQSELMLAEGGPSYNSINSIMWLLSSLMEFAKGEQIPAFNAVKYVNRLLITEKRHALPDMEQLNAFLGLMENLGIYYSDYPADLPWCPIWRMYLHF